MNGYKETEFFERVMYRGGTILSADLWKLFDCLFQRQMQTIFGLG